MWKTRAEIKSTLFFGINNYYFLTWSSLRLTHFVQHPILEHTRGIHICKARLVWIKSLSRQLLFHIGDRWSSQSGVGRMSNKLESKLHQFQYHICRGMTWSLVVNENDFCDCDTIVDNLVFNCFTFSQTVKEDYSLTNPKNNIHYFPGFHPFWYRLSLSNSLFGIFFGFNRVIVYYCVPK